MDEDQKQSVTDVGIGPWLNHHHIQWIEYCIADVSGIFRGKLVARNSGASSVSATVPITRLPLDVLSQTIDGNFAVQYEKGENKNTEDRDFSLVADLQTACLLPWAKRPTASFVCDAYHLTGEIVEYAPRQILQRVLELYQKKGWQPIVAPELEFFVFPSQKSDENDWSKSPFQTQSSPYGIECLDDLGDFFSDILSYCELQGISCDSLIKEVASGQFEINLKHGDALAKADEVCRFKRVVRAVGKKHHLCVSFMAKPVIESAGNSMHIHQSIVEHKSQKNLFSDSEGNHSDLFRFYIGGLKRYLPESTAILLPFINSYRRLAPNCCAPLNVEWGEDNRTIGLRVPSSPANNLKCHDPSRRVENRLPGADSNPYLVMAVTLALGYQGMVEQLDPGTPFIGNAYNLPSTIPKTQESALSILKESQVIKNLLGHAFVDNYVSVKEKEIESLRKTITPWENQYLSGVI